MNALFASSINGTSSPEQSLTKKVANFSRSSMLSSPIEFVVTAKKEQMTPTVQDKFVSCATKKNVITFNGQKKQKNGVDRNRNTLNKSYSAMNGNKEKCVEDGIPVPNKILYSGKIQVEWKRVYGIGAGLNNLGNTCFMNTVIQCLTYCPPLANYLLHEGDHASKCSTNGFCMMCLMQNHVKRTIGKSGETIKPIDIYQRLRLIAKSFQYGRQEDAHEFLRYVIDNLWKSSLAQNHNYSKLDEATKQTTVINQIFGGFHRSQVTCLKCKEKSNTFDHFMDFILDIKQNVMSLEKALEKYNQPELLEQDNLYKCPKCKMKVTANKRFSVYKPPNVATFQLKRFDYNRSPVGKIMKHISFEETLNLRPYMSDSKGEPVMYCLNAVLVHAGATCSSGHYFCYVKNSNGQWYHMDDQRVVPVPISQVLCQPAYVLFYIKVETDRNNLSSKKLMENRNPVLKQNNSVLNFKKGDSPVSKPQPLGEKQVVKNTHVYPPLDIKKTPLSTVNREKIAFEIRTNQLKLQNASPCPPKSKDGRNSPKITSSGNSSPKVNHVEGLVPYNKDSEGSSDENDNRSGSKLKGDGSAEKRSNTSSSISSMTSFKFEKLPDDESAPKFEINRKPASKVIFLGRSSSVTSSNSSISSKATLEDKFMVTDSGLGTKSTSSTNDFQESDSSSKSASINKYADSCVKEKKRVTLDDSSSIITLSDYLPKIPEKSDEKIKDTSHQEDSEKPFRDSKCNFRDSGEPFRFCGQQSIQQNNPFFKRKCNNSDTEVSSGTTKPVHNESGFHSLPKKTKQETMPFENGLAGREILSETGMGGCIQPPMFSLKTREIFSNSPKRLSSPPKMNGPLSMSSTVHSPLRKGNEFCPGSSSQTQHLSSKQNEKSHREFATNENSNDSSEEEVWVEKTMETIAKSREQEKTPKKNSFASSFRSDVASELTNNSNYFYGSTVTKWNGENHYRDSASHNDKHQEIRSYEDEYDRGKVNRPRQNNKYHPYHNSNSFQRFADRNYNKQNHRGKFIKHRQSWQSNQFNYKRPPHGFRKHNNNNYRRNYYS